MTGQLSVHNFNRNSTMSPLRMREFARLRVYLNMISLSIYIINRQDNAQQNKRLK